MLSFLRRWLGRGNPTQDWTAAVAEPMVADLDASALCGARLGDPLEKLRFLGRGAWRELPWRREGARQGTLDYPDRGLALDVSGGKLDGFVLVAAAGARPGAAAFAGRMRFKGAETDFGRLATETRCRDMLGEPWWRDEEEDEILLFYEREGVEWQIEIAKGGAVKALLVLAPPLMADEEQRAAYGVNKPWPPEPGMKSEE